jgi:hypothetical protein
VSEDIVPPPRRSRLERAVIVYAWLAVAAVVFCIASQKFFLGRVSDGWDSPENLSRMQMCNVGVAIDIFNFQRHGLPGSLEDLTQEDERTHQPFIEGGKIPRDPWSTPYDYRVLDERRMKYELSSAGEDKQFGTDDDLFYPERGSP